MNTTALTAPATTKEPGANFVPAEKRSALQAMASRLQIEPDKLLSTLKATAFKGASNEELWALMVVANTYKLSPLLKELYAFPAKGGGIVPVVSVDGWIRMMNDHPMFDGIEFDEKVGENGKPISTTAIIYRKDRTRPVRVTEWYSECKRNTEPWNNQPCRMLRHRAICQGSRIAFGFSGIVDEDEAENLRPAGPLPKVITVDPIQAEPAKIAEQSESLEVLPDPISSPAKPSEAQNPVQTPPATQKPARGAAATAQSELEKFVTEGGHDWNAFARWAEGSGNIPDCTSLSEFSEVPADVAKRLLRAKTGVLSGIAQTKGVA